MTENHSFPRDALDPRREEKWEGGLGFSLLWMKIQTD